MTQLTNNKIYFNFYLKKIIYALCNFSIEPYKQVEVPIKFKTNQKECSFNGSIKKKNMSYSKRKLELEMKMPWCNKERKAQVIMTFKKALKMYRRKLKINLFKYSVWLYLTMLCVFLLGSILIGMNLLGTIFLFIMAFLSLFMLYYSKQNDHHKLQLMIDGLVDQLNFDLVQINEEINYENLNWLKYYQAKNEESVYERRPKDNLDNRKMILRADSYEDDFVIIEETSSTELEANFTASFDAFDK